MKRAVDTSMSVGVCEKAKHSKCVSGGGSPGAIHQNPLGTFTKDRLLTKLY